MRNKFAQTLYELAKQDERIVCIVADISPAGAMDNFRKEFPTRFLNVGVAEQSMIGIAAGMAQRGFKPFCYTIATFALYRPFEFIRNDLAYQGLPVTIVGIGGGLTYSTLGATHHAQEDIAVARAVPGLWVIAPCDPIEVEAATRWCGTRDERATHPVYLRLGKAGEPSLEGGARWEFGKIRIVWRPRADLSNMAILTYGPIITGALGWANTLSADVYSVHTLKPLDNGGLVHLMRQYKEVLVIEETTGDYGLGKDVRALAQFNGLRTKIFTRGLKDEFTHIYGTHNDLLKHHGLLDVV